MELTDKRKTIDFEKLKQLDQELAKEKLKLKRRKGKGSSLYQSFQRLHQQLIEQEEAK